LHSFTFPVDMSHTLSLSALTSLEQQQMARVQDQLVLRLLVPPQDQNYDTTVLNACPASQACNKILLLDCLQVSTSRLAPLALCWTWAKPVSL
jgi:hypothetical protein